MVRRQRAAKRLDGTRKTQSNDGGHLTSLSIALLLVEMRGEENRRRRQTHQRRRAHHPGLRQARRRGHPRPQRTSRSGGEGEVKGTHRQGTKRGETDGLPEALVRQAKRRTLVRVTQRQGPWWSLFTHNNTRVRSLNSRGVCPTEVKKYSACFVFLFFCFFCFFFKFFLIFLLLWCGERLF